MFIEEGEEKVVKGLLIEAFTANGLNVLREGGRQVFIPSYFDMYEDFKEVGEGISVNGEANEFEEYEPEGNIGVQMEWGVILLPRIKYIEDVLTFGHEEWGHKYYLPGDPEGRQFMEWNKIFMEVVGRAIEFQEVERDQELVLNEAEKKAVKMRLKEEFRAYIRLIRILKRGWGEQLVGEGWEEPVKEWVNSCMSTYLDVAGGCVSRSAGIEVDKYRVN